MLLNLKKLQKHYKSQCDDGDTLEYFVESTGSSYLPFLSLFSGKVKTVKMEHSTSFKFFQGKLILHKPVYAYEYNDGSGCSITYSNLQNYFFNNGSNYMHFYTIGTRKSIRVTFLLGPFTILVYDGAKYEFIYSLYIDKHYALNGNIDLENVDSSKLMLFFNYGLFSNIKGFNKRYSSFVKNINHFATTELGIPVCYVKDFKMKEHHPQFRNIESVNLEDGQLTIKSNDTEVSTKLLV